MSDEEATQEIMPKNKGLKRQRSNESLDSIFAVSNKSNNKKLSSTVSRAQKDGGTAYISMNADDGATHLLKIEVYDLKKLTNVQSNQHWKHSNMRIKYYCNEKDKSYNDVNNIIYNISKQISKAENCKRYFFNNK